MAEPLTVLRLNLSPTLARRLRSTNSIESMISVARTHSANVRHWHNGTMALRWYDTGRIEAGNHFRSVNGHLHLPSLRAALDAHVAAETLGAVRHDYPRGRRLTITSTAMKLNRKRDNLPKGPAADYQRCIRHDLHCRAGGHRMTVTHTDRHAVCPSGRGRSTSAWAGAYDAVVTLKGGVFPLVVKHLGKNSRGQTLGPHLNRFRKRPRPGRQPCRPRRDKRSGAMFSNSFYVRYGPSGDCVLCARSVRWVPSADPALLRRTARDWGARGLRWSRLDS